jgi:ribonuclease D
MDSPTHLRHSISREAMAKLPIGRYPGEVCVVATQADLERARGDLREEHIVGLDTETRPAFRKGESHSPSLVQVATARSVWLFQLRRAECHPVIAELLGDARTVKAGISLADDMKALARVFPFRVENLLDLGELARRNRFAQTGLRNLAGMVLGFRIPKGAQTTNWAAAQLSPAQIAYAATDAWACRELFLRFEGLGLLRPTPSEGAAAREA